MDAHSILMAALGGGAGGALGGLLAGLLARPLSVDWRRWIVILGVVVCAAIGARLAHTLAGARTQADPAEVETALMADAELGALAAAWKERDPASFAAFVGRIGAGGGADTVDEARAGLIAAARPRLAHLDDADLVALIRLARDQMRELATSHPIACHPLFHGRRFGDITPYLSEDLRRREITLLAQAFRADPQVQHDVLQGPALDAAIAALATETRADFGEDIALIAPDANIEVRAPRVCEAAAAIYEHMQALPQRDAAALMRGLITLTR